MIKPLSFLFLLSLPVTLWAQQQDLSGIYFIDTHNDVLSKQISSGADLSLVQKDLELDLPKARQGHLAAQVFSIW